MNQQTEMLNRDWSASRESGKESVFQIDDASRCCEGQSSQILEP